MTKARPPRGMLVVMTAFETIQLVAASLWIFVVLAGLGFGGRLWLSMRRRRRRMNRVVDAFRIPLMLGARGAMNCGEAVDQLRLLLGGSDRRAAPISVMTGARLFVTGRTGPRRRRAWRG